MGLSDFKTFFSMTYFTDKAFSASWLDRSKGLSDMLVKKDDEDESIPQSQITSQTKKNNETTFDDNYRLILYYVYNVPKKRDFRISALYGFFVLSGHLEAF